MSSPTIPLIDTKGLHSRLYERPNPNGVGRQVVKESLSFAELEYPQIFADQSAFAIRNEYHAIEYVRQYTTIPVPNIVSYRDEPGLPVQIVMEYVESAVPPHKIKVSTGDRNIRLLEQLRGFLDQLHAITDPRCRSFAGLPLFAHRIEETHIPLQEFTYRQYNGTVSPYVLCHGDIAWHNLLLDPDTFEIKCVLDWEYAGFYPVEVESDYWRRGGPIYASLGREYDDINDVLAIIYSHLEMDSVREVILDEDRGSNVRQLLLKHDLPTGIKASVATVLCQGVDTSRERMATTIRDLGQHFETDDDTVFRVVNEINDNDGNLNLHKLSAMRDDHAKIAQISKQLPGAFATLADKLESTGAPYLPLRDHLSAELAAWKPVFDKEKLKALPETEGWNEESALRAKAREMSVERRNVGDEAYKAAEVQKWSAIKQFAEHLLRLSTAAEIVIPYLATHDQEYPSPNIDSERAWAEYQATQIASLKGAETGDGVVQGGKEDFLVKWAEMEEDRAKDVANKVRRRLRNETRIPNEDTWRLYSRNLLRPKPTHETITKKDGTQVVRPIMPRVLRTQPKVKKASKDDK